MARWKRWAKELAIIVIVTALAAGVIGYLRAPSYKDAVLPPLKAVMLDGTVFETDETEQRPYILHFWATWCPVCRAEAGNIDALAEDVKVVTVAVKSGSDEKIALYLHENGLTFPVINDQNGAIATQFEISVFPTTVIVGKNGKVFWAESGYSTTWGLKLRFWLATIF